MNNRYSSSKFQSYRSQLRRGGGSEVQKETWSNSFLSVPSGLSWIWSIWGVALIGVSVAFVAIYYFDEINTWRDRITGTVVVAAAATSNEYLTPMFVAIDTFNNSINAGGIIDISSYANASIAGYPLFKEYSYIEQVEMYIGSDVMRLRPSVGTSRVVACNNKYPLETVGYQLTNILDVPVIYVPSNTACQDDQNYCRFGLACETNSSLAALTNETLTGPLLFYPPEASTVSINALEVSFSSYANSTIPIRVVINLSQLTATLVNTYPDYRVIVIDALGNGIATSQVSYYQPFEIVNLNGTATLQLATNVYDLSTGQYPWVSLLPPVENLTTLTYPYSVYDSMKDWNLRMEGVTGGEFFVLVAAKRSDFTITTVFALGICILVVALSPFAVFLSILLFRVVKTLLPRKQVMTGW